MIVNLKENNINYAKKSINLDRNNKNLFCDSVTPVSNGHLYSCYNDEILSKTYKTYNNYIDISEKVNNYNEYGEKLFDTVEDVWFWFVKYEMDKENYEFYKPRKISGVERPCFLDDIHIIVSRLYLSGKITKTELHVMFKYGKLQRSPDKYYECEETELKLWQSGMDKLKTPLIQKGIVVTKIEKK